jgi:predicted DNA-binding protein
MRHRHSTEPQAETLKPAAGSQISTIKSQLLSPRMDEAVIQRIGMLDKELRRSKKADLENAIGHYAEKMEAEFKMNILEHT